MIDDKIYLGILPMVWCWLLEVLSCLVLTPSKPRCWLFSYLSFSFLSFNFVVASFWFCPAPPPRPQRKLVDVVDLVICFPNRSLAIFARQSIDTSFNIFHYLRWSMLKFFLRSLRISRDLIKLSYHIII